MSDFDFSGLDVFDEDKIENGAWLHLIDTTTGEPKYLAGDESKPSRVRVRSVNSKAFDKHLDTVQRRAVDRSRQRKGKKQNDELIAQLKKERPESFASLVSEMENVSLKQPGIIAPPREDLMAFAKDLKRRWVVDQVLEFAAEDANYAPGNGDAADD